MALTVAMYSHDSVGLGHTRRNRAIAFALAAAFPGQTNGILIAGNRQATAFDLPEGWDWLVLPGFSRTEAGYGARHVGMSTAELAQLRSNTIAASLVSIEPDLFIADRHPFGVHGELEPALDLLRAAGCRTVLGLREVLDAPEVVAAEWQAIGGGARVNEYYDAAWVYGDREVHDALATGEVPAEMAPKAQFTGYLTPPWEGTGLRETPWEEPCLITTVGGGSDGYRLASLAAQAEAPAGVHHLVITGPQMPEADFHRVVAAAEASGHGAEVTRFVPDLPGLLRRAAGVVCMGGYNSVVEVLATDTPALVVPRVARRAEQRIRATAVSRAGGVDTRLLDELSATELSTWLHAAVGKTVARGHLDRGGLCRVGQLAQELMGVGNHA